MTDRYETSFSGERLFGIFTALFPVSIPGMCYHTIKQVISYKNSNFSSNLKRRGNSGPPWLCGNTELLLCKETALCLIEKGCKEARLSWIEV